MERIRNFFVPLRDKVKSNIFIIVPLVVGLLFMGLTYWQYENAIDAAESIFEKEKLFLEVLLTVSIAFIALIALAVAGSSFRHSKHTANQQTKLNTDIANRQEKQNDVIATQQHYRDAIGFLSSGSPAVRRKGVEDLYDYATKNNDKAEEIWKILNDHVKYFTRDKSYQESFPNGPAGDIQLILKIQSSAKYIDEDKNYPFKDTHIDWNNAWLRGADLRETKLQGAHLWKTQLQGAYLWEARLHGAFLWGVQLQEADLTYTQLQGATLHSAQLQGVNLRRSKLQKADLSNTRLQGANLYRAKLQGANLYQAELQAANLCYAQLQEADLREAKLQGAFSSPDTSDTIYRGRGTTGKTWFERAISFQKEKETEVDSVIFEGGITDLSAIKEKMDLEAAFWEMNIRMRNCKQALVQLSEILETCHSGEAVRGEDIPRTNEYLESQEAVTGTYTKKEADKWINKYNEAMGWRNENHPL